MSSNPLLSLMRKIFNMRLSLKCINTIICDIMSIIFSGLLYLIELFNFLFASTDTTTNETF